jgi:hypothetical protein
MISETLIKALNCRCNECSHSWQVVGTVAPSVCPECNSTEWNTVYQKEQEQDNYKVLSRDERDKEARARTKEFLSNKPIRRISTSDYKR